MIPLPLQTRSTTTTLGMALTTALTSRSNRTFKGIRVDFNGGHTLKFLKEGKNFFSSFTQDHLGVLTFADAKGPGNMATGIDDFELGRGRSLQRKPYSPNFTGLTEDTSVPHDPWVTLYTSMCATMRCSSPGAIPLPQDASWPCVSMWVVVDDALNPQNTRYPLVMTSESLTLIVEGTYRTVVIPGNRVVSMSTTADLLNSQNQPIAPNPRRSQSSRGSECQPTYTLWKRGL